MLKQPVFGFAVLGIFLYVGAEVCMARFLLPILRSTGLPEATAVKLGPAMFFGLLTVGRLLGGVVLWVVKPRIFLLVSALLGAVGGLLLMSGVTYLAVAGVVAAGLGFANIWPLLFSVTVEEKPECASELSGLMCMAISGGAVIPLLMGGMVDMQWGALAFAVPVACFAYLFVLAFSHWKKSKAL